MEMSARALNIVIRLCGGAALALGLAFWLGYARGFTRLHIFLGMALVVSLWALAAIAWKQTARGRLAAFAVAWGLLTWYLGITQGRLLPGSFHWIVEVAHLGVGVVTIGLGSRLAVAVAHERAASSSI